MPPAAPRWVAPTPGVNGSSADGFGAGFRIIEAKGQGLEFPLPDPGNWRRDVHEKHSWVARHRRSSSELLVRSWRFDDIARPESCERQAREWRRGLPEPQPAEIVETGERLLAGAYRSQVSVGIRALAGDGPQRLLGYALGFGSAARSCLAMAFSSVAEGPEARRVLAQRLALITGSVFERARRREIEGRVVVPRL